MISDTPFFVKCSYKKLVNWLKLEFEKDYLPFIYKPEYRIEDIDNLIIETHVDLWPNTARDAIDISVVFYLQITNLDTEPRKTIKEYGINTDELIEPIKEWLESDEISLVIFGASGSNLMPFPIKLRLMECFEFYPSPLITPDYYKNLITKARCLGLLPKETKIDAPIKKKKVKIFISSTSEDLKIERSALIHAMQSMKSVDFSAMEFFGSNPEKPEKTSIRELVQCDIYLGIIGFRYGSGITEKEYYIAQEKKIPSFIYFKDDEVPIPPKYVENNPEKLIKLKRLKKKILSSHTISYFTSADQLTMRVVIDLHNYILKINEKS